MTLLHYFNKKENKDKLFAKDIYSEIIYLVKKIIQDLPNNLEKNFRTSFEITTILLFSIFYISKENAYKTNNLLSQEIMNYFIEDLDRYFREQGIGDMNIGKYVKSYVKKFYFRVKKLEILFENINEENIKSYLEDLKIIKTKENIIKMPISLCNIINELTYRSVKHPINKELFINIYI